MRRRNPVDLHDSVSAQYVDREGAQITLAATTAQHSSESRNGSARPAFASADSHGTQKSGTTSFKPRAAPDEHGGARRKPRKEKEKAYTTERVGIWEIEREVHTWRDSLPFSRLVDDYREIVEALPFVVLFIGELITIGPHLALAYLCLRIVQAVLPAYRLRTHAQTIRAAQQAVDERALDLTILLAVFGQQVLIVIASRCLEWSVQRITNGLSYRLRRIFELHTLRARFKLDLPTLEDENTQRELKMITGRGGADRSWHALQAIVNSGANVIETGTSFMFLLSMLKDGRGDRLIACVSLLKPLLEMASTEAFYTGNYWAKIVDATAKRVENLKHIAHTNRFHKDIISFSLGDYITEEFTLASDALNAKQSFHTPFNRTKSPLSPAPLLLRLADELPLFVLALQAIYTPRHVPMSFANFTLISKTTSDFSRKLIGFARGRGPAQSLAQHAGTIRAIYDATTLPVQIFDGTVEYKRDSEKPGMAIELRNVGFRYPGQEKEVLKDVTCSIPSGALVIILGSNGGGKTSLMKLLPRLYDTTEGQILINGRDIREYRADSLRKAMAALWQDHQVMPLTAEENIRIGNPSIHDIEAVRQAADRAGCLDFLLEMPQGLETYLGMPDVGSGRIRTSGFGRPAFMRKQAAEQEREIKLSGGQLQKLALARVLMRQEQADLLLFDEPSAALDARAERDLFLRVNELRKTGKTIIWVSHRMHLAKHADLVIMIDKARIVEMGSPDDLLKDPTSTFAELYSFQNQ